MPNTSKGVEIDHVKEKLAELLEERRMQASEVLGSMNKGFGAWYADHLIVHGVTVQEWISVKDRLPEDVYGKGREKIVVLVCTESGKVSQCARIADYDCSTDAKLTQVKWTKNGQFYWSKGKHVTHWMPLPQPPKGEE